MSWVNAQEAKHWIRDHALKVEQSSVTSDGQYDEGNDYCIASCQVIILKYLSHSVVLIIV